MSDDDELKRDIATQKDRIIQEVLHEEDLYKILGASRSASPAELRRCYLERSKICHPDKPPFHPQSTSAFQRLGFAFDILKSPSARRTYNAASSPTATSLPDKTTFLGGEHTFRSAVETILQEFISGDFVLVRRWLEGLHTQYPHLVSEEVVVNVERSFIRIRELVLTTQVYALLVYIELGRIHKVQKRLMGLGYLDVVGRARLTIHLVRVTLAVPMRVDRALKRREEKAWRAKVAGCQAAGLPIPQEQVRRAGILNDRVSRVLEFIVGRAGTDEGVDECWDGVGTTTTTSNR
ncbi:putative DnaJ like protein subfamily B member 11 [Xylogone sp. PMI_703]|nr:putative DnaJ like protein subfamily B member 11 [Xylogone sp. PMI_703]